MPITAIRGSIYDRNGTVLAQDKPIFNISVLPYQIHSKRKKIFKQVSDFLHLDPETLADNYKKNTIGLFSPAHIIINVDKKTAITLKDKFGEYLLISPEPQRHYSYPNQLAHVIGYVKDATSIPLDLKKYGYTSLERIGFLGIEQYYDVYLKGENGGDLIEVDARGKVVGFLGKRISQQGKNISLTVDMNMQKDAAWSMKKKKGTLIFIDSMTGEILALYSSPSFDSNDFVKGKNVNTVFADKKSPLLNRAIQSTYPIGSAFKPLLAIAGLEEKKIWPEKCFLCNGELRIGIAKFKCWNTHFSQDLSEALAHSCNVYFYNLGLLLGPNLISDWAKRFGLDSLTGIDLPYEKKGFVPSVGWKKSSLRKNWFAGDTLNFSIGQGFLNTTPLAITVAINAIANDGYLINPHILKAVDKIPSGLSSKTYLGLNEKNIQIIKSGLRKVVASESGTAHALEKLNLEIAGKTGTAQTSGKSHGWFIGFFPYKNPKYTICVFLENGGSSYEAIKVVFRFLRLLKNKGLIEVQ